MLCTALIPAAGAALVALGAELCGRRPEARRSRDLRRIDRRMLDDIGLTPIALEAFETRRGRR